MVLFKSKKKLLTAFAVFLVLGLVANAAFAGTGGDEFTPIYEWLKDAMKGILGRLVALAMIFIGVVMGAVRQSLIGFVVGFTAGILFFFAPDILESLTGASLRFV